MRLQIPDQLPIAARADEIADALQRHQVLVVAGETGSGKTTQLPKIALAAGRQRVGHTQPRRLAARTLAARIAEECGVELGGEVGFAIRFTDRTDPATRIKVMTDGILLAELRRDRLLRRYDTLIVDEAHERSLNIDFLLGYLARLLPRRPDLKLVITSATIDLQRFADHFGGAPIIEVSGRTYPVEIRYRPSDEAASDDIDAITGAVAECLREGDGDILVFLSGQREIADAAEALRPVVDRSTSILPLYSRLSAAEQHRVFTPGGGRRIVLATNVAETSVTVPGIRFVIDPGMARISRYSKRLKVQRLPIEPISQASANQRAGRCGRVRDGIAIRLYSEQEFAARPAFTDPEILRTNLASVLLQMADLRLGDIADFPFLDPPDTRSVRDGLALLRELGALSGDRLTAIGRQMARLPLDPHLARMVLAAREAGCVREVVIIAAGLTIQDPRERPEEQRARAEAAHARFRDRTSDFLTLLNLWDHVDGMRGSRLRRACREEFLHYLRIREWQDLVGQLRSALADLGLPWSSAREDHDAIHRALLTGMLSGIGQYDPLRRDYLGARGARFVIFPGSALYRTTPDWVMSAELVETSRLFARANAVVKPEWIEQAAGDLLQRRYSEPRWSARRGSAVAEETTSLYGVPLATRTVPYGRIDPVVSRELFIRSALVEGQWRTRHRFWHRNNEALERARELEERSRRRGLVIDDDGLFAFYDARIPPEVVSAAHLDSWLRKQPPGVLELSEQDLRTGDLPSAEQFPRQWTFGPATLDMEYRFAPGDPADGVTLDVPLSLLPSLDPAELPGAAPGHRAELVAALLRSLPKPVRRLLGPSPALEVGEGPLLTALARAASRAAGVPVGVGDFDLDRVPRHLLPRYRVRDGDRVLGEGRDLAALQRAHAPARAAMVARAAAEVQVSGATEWTFGALSKSVAKRVGGVEVRGYPTVIDRRTAVDVVVLPEPAPVRHRRGVRRLVAMHVPDPGPRGHTMLGTRERLVLGRYPGGAQAVLSDLADACIYDLLPEPVRDEAAFRAAVARIAVQLPAAYRAALPVVVECLGAAWEAERAIGAGESADDIRAEIDRLFGPRFLGRYTLARLPDLRRYAAALRWRATRAADDPAADLRRLAEVRQAEDLLAEHIDSWPVRDPEAADETAARARLLADEFRVGVFAQHLGTSLPVSLPRIRKWLTQSARPARP